MTRIDQNQQLIALVRQQLSRVSRGKAERAAKVQNNKGPVSSQKSSPLQQLTEVEGFTEEEQQRALVHGILVEEFGDGLINEAQFQQIVDRITRQLRSDGETAVLLNASIKDLEKKPD